MKLTRASLVALGTAAALTVSSLSAPAFADEGEGPSGALADAGSSSFLTTADETTDSVFDLSSGDDKLDLDTLTSWISIIGSVIEVIADIVNIGK